MISMDSFFMMLNEVIHTASVAIASLVGVIVFLYRTASLIWTTQRAMYPATL
jgi:hypothetical protein